jgi:mannosyltransferase
MVGFGAEGQTATGRQALAATQRRGRRRARASEFALLAAMVLFALALRLYRLDAQSLWNDEGTTVQLVGADLATIARLAANDIHPPLYYYALRVWADLFGNSEFAVRSFSALLGTLLVILVFVLANKLFNRTVALAAALLSAISPLQVYYSQETRMYMLATVLGAASMLLFLRMLPHTAERQQGRSGSVGWSASTAYVLVSAAALYTHYFAFTLMLAQNLVWALVLLSAWRNAADGAERTFRRDLVRWVTLQVATALLYAPWLLVTWRQLGRWHAVSEPFGLPWLVKQSLLAFSLGITVEASAFTISFAALAGLLAALGSIGWLLPKKRDTLRGALLAVLYCGVPVLVMYLVSRRRPMWNPKFLLLATPGFHLLVAAGVTSLASLAGGLFTGAPRIVLASLLVLVGLASGHSLDGLYHDPRYARDDYRGVVRYIESVARPGDAILLNAPSQIETVAYYYTGELPMYPLPRHRPLRRDETEADLESITAEHDRIFAILWATDESDKDRFIEGWLDARAYKALDKWYGDVRLAAYSVPRDVPTEITHPLDVMLGDSILLLGYALPRPELGPGDVLQLTLFWEAAKPVERRFKVFVHLVDGDGGIIAQRDAEPGGGVKLTNTWRPGEIVLDNYGVLIPMGTAPDEYRLEIGMYHVKDATRLAVMVGGAATGDSLSLVPVTVR